MKISILTINRGRTSFKKLLHYFHGLTLSIYDGFTPIDLTAGKKYYSTRLQREIGAAEYCCRLGHLQILSDFLRSNEDVCMVLEDDIEFRVTKDELTKLLQCYSEDSYFNGSPSILLLGAQNGIAQRKLLFGKKLNNGLFLIPNVYSRFVWRTAAYVVNRSGAQLLLQAHEEILSVIDDWKMASDKGINLLYTDLTDHPTDMAASNINHERMEPDNVTLYRKIAQVIFIMVSITIGLKKL